MAHAYAIDNLINGKYEIPEQFQYVADKFHELDQRYKKHTVTFMVGTSMITASGEWSFWLWVDHHAIPKTEIQRTVNKIRYVITKDVNFNHAIKCFPEMLDAEWQYWDCNIESPNSEEIQDGNWEPLKKE